MSDYLSELAAAIRGALPSGQEPDEPHLQRLFRMYAVLAFAKGTATTAHDVHNAWVAWMAELDAEHAALRPYDELESNDQKQDEPFLRAIHAVSSARGLDGRNDPERGEQPEHQRD